MRNSFRSLFLPTFLTVCSIATSAHSLVEPSGSLIVEASSCSMDPATFITWSPAEIVCPVCETKNIFMVWGSYGSYIYQYPSKYQLVFWPFTDSQSWYSCKKCRLTAYMDDFKSTPKEKIPALRELLQSVTLPPQKELSEKESFERPPYLGISIADRLVVAEKVYRVLGRTDEGFWEHFYRVMGYHFDGAKKEAEAADARRKALNIAESWVLDKSKAGEHKEFLYICGAMHHFLKDDAAAIKALEQAATLKYSKSELKPEQNKGYDQYLSTLIKEYLEMLKKGSGPRIKTDKIALNELRQNRN